MPFKGTKQIIYFNTPELCIFEVPSLYLIVIQANGEVPTHIYREGLSMAAEVTIEKCLHFWLINNKVQGIISPADQIWTNEVIAPQLAHHSCIKKMAFIRPMDMLSLIILENIMDQARDIVPFEMQFFDHISNVINWFQDTSATHLQ
ncbi:hypothetical protein ACSX1A_09530 [Pontibacter sp. MBLB2868]|uniref:hypothetical protein n=1 Tax=Pontibacter sp. MBLB2868 TaxID=3451555 RepID=UPI003F74BE2E